MTDNEIIKALARCTSIHTSTTCLECPYSAKQMPIVHFGEVNCKDALLEKSLGLIWRQQAEIERLKKENTVLREDNHILATEYAVKAKSEAITEYKEKLHPYNLHYGNLRMEIAREFADRVKKEGWLQHGGTLVVSGCNIDNLLKEMEQECEGKQA